MSDFCERFPLSAFTHVDRKTALFTRLRCGQWSCEYCAAKNASIWRAFLLTKMPANVGHWYLLTLTAHSRLRTQAGSFDNIRKNIGRFLKRIRRVFGKVEYVRVFERHPTSEAMHVHFIISNLTPGVVRGANAKHQEMFLAVTERRARAGYWSINTYMKHIAQDCGMGYIADCRLIEGDGSKAVWYVTKYLTKSQQEFNIKGLRHVQTSRGIGSPKPEKKYQWKVVSFVTTADFLNGQTLIDLQTGEAVDADYWNEQDVYPPEAL